MTTKELPTAIPTRTADRDEPVADATGQLLLLPTTELAESDAHARFRLSKQTRERGLQHIAEIRAQLAAAQQRAATDNVVTLRPRREPAA